MHAQHRVVRLNARRGDLRARPDRERDLRLLAVVDGETLEEQAAETGASTTAARVEDPNPPGTLSLLFGDGALSQAESDLFSFLRQLHRPQSHLIASCHSESSPARQDILGSPLRFSFGDRKAPRRHEALKTRAVVRELAQAVEHQVDDLLA